MSARRLVIPALGALALGCSAAPRAAIEGHRRSEEPHVALGAEGEVLLAWGAIAADGRADILLSRDGGDAVRVNATPLSAVAGHQVGPRTAVLDSGRVVVSWVDRSHDLAGDIALSASSDGGRAFGPAVRVNDDRGRAGQEYQDAAALPGGGVALAWLDERDAPPSDRNAKQVYAAVSRDGGRTFGPNLRVTAAPGGVCPCCRPAIAAGAGGSIHVAYRDRTAEGLVVRVATLAAGATAFAAPVTVSAAPWRFPACPSDGPALAVGPTGRIVAGWMDASGGVESIRLAESRDGGASFGAPRVLMDAGTPGHLILAWGDGVGLVAAWEAEQGRVWAAAVDPDRGAPRAVAGEEGAHARSPSLAASGGRAVIAWAESRWNAAADSPRLESTVHAAALMGPDVSRTIAP